MTLVRTARTARSSATLMAAVLALSTLLAVPTTALARKTVGLSAGSFDFSVAAGGAGNGTLDVINAGDEPIKVFVYVADQKVDAKGKITYVTPNRDSAVLSSPSTWLRLQMPEDTKSLGNTPYLELKVGQRVPVKFSFDTPSGVPAGDHQVVLFFEMFDFVQKAEGAVSKVSGRLGSRIRIRVQGQFVEKLDIRPFATRALVMGNTIPYVFTARNDGNIDKLIDTSIAVFDSNEDEILSSNIASETTLFAGTSAEKDGQLKLKGMPLGKYTVKVTMKYAKEGAAPGAPLEEIVKSRTVWVFPLWLIVLVIVVVGGLLMWASWRGAVRSARKRIERADRADRADDIPGVGASRRGASRSRATGKPRRAVENDLDAHADDPAEPVAVEPAVRAGATSDLWDDEDIDFADGVPDSGTQGAASDVADPAAE